MSVVPPPQFAALHTRNGWSAPWWLDRFDFASHVRAFGWVFAAQVLSMVALLATIKVATNYLGPADYGRFAAATSLAAVVQVCLQGAIAQTAARFLFLANGTGSLGAYLRTLAGMMAIAIGGILAMLGIAHAFGLTEALAVPASLLFVFLAMSGCQQVLLAMLNAGKARRAVAVGQAIDAVGRPLFIFILCAVAPTPTAALYGCTISSIVVVCALLVAFRPLLRDLLRAGEDAYAAREPALPTSMLTRRMLSYTYPFVIFGAVGVLGSHGERLLLAAWLPWDAVGAYILMAQLAAAPILLFMNVTNQFCLPLFFERNRERGAEALQYFRHYLMFSGLGTAVLALAFWLSGPYLVSLVASEKFLGHEKLLVLLILSSALFGMAQQLVLPGLHALRPGIYVLPKLIHSVALLLAAVFAVPFLGMIGMAVSSLSAALLYLLSVMAANANERGRPARVEP